MFYLFTPHVVLEHHGLRNMTKDLGNGFNIWFNIRSILLNSDVKTIYDTCSIQSD